MQKEMIADAFERRFHHFGFSKTSVDEVARELRISKKTIYSLFTSKEEIFHYIVERNSRMLFAQFSVELSALHDSTEKLHALTGLIFGKVREFTAERDPLDFRFEIAEEAFRSAYRKQLCQLLCTGMQNGEFVQADENILVSLLDGLIREGLHEAFEKKKDNETIRRILELTATSVQKIVQK